jgi:hypothetical protein
VLLVDLDAELRSEKNRLLSCSVLSKIRVRARARARVRKESDIEA